MVNKHITDNRVPEINDVALATFDASEIKVIFKKLVNNNYLNVGENFYFQNNWNICYELSKNYKLNYI